MAWRFSGPAAGGYPRCGVDAGSLRFEKECPAWQRKAATGAELPLPTSCAQKVGLRSPLFYRHLLLAF